MNRRIAIAALVFTVGCGGSPFTAGDLDLIHGDAAVTLEDAAMNLEDAGGLTDKGPQEGGSGLDSAAPDGGLSFAEAGGDAAKEGHDAGPVPDACAAPPNGAWTCTFGEGPTGGGPPSTIDVAPGLYCLGTYRYAPAVQSLIATTAPDCACGVPACACAEATNPCGTYAFISCTDVAPGEVEVVCNAQGAP